MGNDFDWFHSPILVVALIIVLVALPCFIIWELGERHPVIDMRLFAQRNYAIATICSVVGFFVIQGSLSLFVSQLQLLLGYSSSLAGGVYLSMLLLSVPSAAIVHELCKRVDIRLICCLNFLGFAVTLTWLGLFDKTASFDQIAWPMTFFGFSLAMFFAPLANLAMHGLQGARLMRAAEEFVLLRTVAGGFGIALQGVVLFRRTPYHALDLSDAFGGRRFSELDLMTQLTDKLEPLGFTPGMATSQAGRFLQQEAALLALERRLSARRRHIRWPRRLRLARPRHPSAASDRGARAETTHGPRADGTDMTRRRLSVAPAAGLLFASRRLRGNVAERRARAISGASGHGPHPGAIGRADRLANRGGLAQRRVVAPLPQSRTRPHRRDGAG